MGAYGDEADCVGLLSYWMRNHSLLCLSISGLHACAVPDSSARPCWPGPTDCGAETCWFQAAPMVLKRREAPPEYGVACGRSWAGRRAACCWGRCCTRSCRPRGTAAGAPSWGPRPTSTRCGTPAFQTTLRICGAESNIGSWLPQYEEEGETLEGRSGEGGFHFRDLRAVAVFLGCEGSLRVGFSRRDFGRGVTAAVTG